MQGHIRLARLAMETILSAGGCRTFGTASRASTLCRRLSRALHLSGKHRASVQAVTLIASQGKARARLVTAIHGRLCWLWSLLSKARRPCLA
jgi:hypothetical protein